jgi:PASTA domain
MKRRLFILTVLGALVVLVAAGGGSAAYGVVIGRATVNRDHSVTISWVLANSNVYNVSVAVDWTIVQRWSSPNQSTSFTTPLLAGGRHTITVEAVETFQTSTNYGPSCVINSDRSYWVCRRTLQSSIAVGVPSNTTQPCVVPNVVGLRLEAAKSRIGVARCSLGAVRRIDSDRRAGTVLAQQPKTGKRLSKDAAIRLVVSNGRPRVSARG